MPSTRTALVAALAATTALAALPLVAPLHAQNGRKAAGASRVPPGHVPPRDLCRVWYEGVPPGRQPAPVDCDVAERQAARAGRSATVVYGADARRGDGRWERDDDRRDDDRRDDDRRDDDRRDDDRRDDDRRDDDRRDGRWDPRNPTGRYPDARDAGRNRAGERPDARRDGRYDPRYDPRYENRDDARDDARYGDRAGRRLPVMPTAAALERGRGEDPAWLGRGDFRARWSDANRDGRPEQVWWLDGRGAVAQVWSDVNRDGRVDRVTYYANGRAVRTVG